MGIGIILYSLTGKFDEILKQNKEIDQYINIYSIQGTLKEGEIKEKLSNNQKMINCEDQIDYSKFKRIKRYPIALCIDQDKGYNLRGNIDSDRVESFKI